MRSYFVETRHGAVVLAAEPALMSRRSPITLLIHGAFRAPDNMVPISKRLGDVVFASLPGHRGAPELRDSTLGAWTEAFSEATATLSRPVVILGESLGGLVALGMKTEAPRVALDPFLRTGHQAELSQAVARARTAGRFRGAADILSDGADFSHLAPASDRSRILAGSWPGSLMDAADEAAFGRVERVPGGHCLVEDNPDACICAVRDLLALA